MTICGRTRNRPQRGRLTGDAASATSGPGRRLLLVVLVAGLLGQAVLVAQQRSTGGSGQSPEALAEEYRRIVDRNIFSRFARSPRPQPQPEATRPERPPAPPPGASYILSGVITGGNENLALVEDSSTRQTRVFRQGAETPLGRLETITSEGISIRAAGELRAIPVGYTLSGERSAKLASTMTLASGAGPSTSSSESSPAASRFRGRGGRPGAPGTGSSQAGGGGAAPAAGAGETPPAARAEILRRLRERRVREMGQEEGEVPSNGSGSEDAAPESPPLEGPPDELAEGAGTEEE